MLLDSDGDAAEVIETRAIGATTFLSPSAVGTGLRSFLKGNKQGKTGRRPLQLGATVVVGPHDEVLYADYENHPGDHADLDDVIAAASAS